ncbi:MAG: glycosyltransferase [Deltaproteobacteria bacterium]|nr:glycosyltransferase [Deltaproteobacteria bacterium]
MLQKIAIAAGFITLKLKSRDIALAGAGQKAIILMLSAILLYLLFHFRTPSRLTLLGDMDSALANAFCHASILAAGMFLISFAYRIVLWLKYRPMRCGAEGAELPPAVVVIPAYNEGRMVQNSIVSALFADYPDKRIICVDDGSSDDTFAYMEEARRIAPEKIELIRLPRNMGKRRALYAGIKKGIGDFRAAGVDGIIITLDSDTIIERDALKNIAAPFAQNPKTGAVAGKIKVFNKDCSLITRMLSVRYILGFDFTRAYQSMLKTVFCCPGAFTAYRASAIEPHLDGWLEQTFLGKHCTNGDDHSLTNFVLSGNSDVLYQSNAVAYTVVPHTYKKLCRMYLRWARSNIRESLRYLGFSMKRLAVTKTMLAFLDGYIHFLSIPLRYCMLLFSYLLILNNFELIFRTFAAGTLVAALYSIFYLKSEKSSDFIYGFLYSFFSIIALQWIYPYAGITLRSNRWLTR